MKSLYLSGRRRAQTGSITTPYTPSRSPTITAKNASSFTRYRPISTWLLRSLSDRLTTARRAGLRITSVIRIYPSSRRFSVITGVRGRRLTLWRTVAPINRSTTSSSQLIRIHSSDSKCQVRKNMLIHITLISQTKIHSSGSKCQDWAESIVIGYRLIIKVVPI